MKQTTNHLQSELKNRRMNMCSDNRVRTRNGQFSLILVKVFEQENLFLGLRSEVNKEIQIHSERKNLKIMFPTDRGSISTAAFKCKDLKRAKRKSSCQCLFANLGSLHVRAARNTLVKSTQDRKLKSSLYLQLRIFLFKTV